MYLCKFISLKEGKGSFQRSVLPFPDISSSVYRDQIPYEIPVWINNK